ncbi:filamin-A-like isoform X3 [Dreissena polymorpha]|uniref:filamin-A-like isoform X1 n=1 Tax=Dreissena polymorpha TaxID=45954 RepID=UPI002264E76C|nr:filamin-A-like isoform X1 [Dreissena polymorpha]XP_052216596.1 filamin-A-like isoform X3 [Dreissena polymorpha]
MAAVLDEQWIGIQETTFRNWCNEQLKVSGRKLGNLVTDLCDGVCLVALVEALQLRKIGKVYTKPTSKIQMLQNVSLALKAITDDNVKLVNVGGDDIVNGNTKIIFGLVWSLVQRYQISGKKSKAPPKKLMTIWFRSLLPDLDITNFTTDWNDGIALHALIDQIKPGVSPEWRKLRSEDRVENCRKAMLIAKEQLNVPRVISPEDFANSALDELSSMTYLSYFVKHESPGYYHTLNWACKQLRTTNITNLTTDWNDGYFLCAIVVSLGEKISGWPNLDRTKALENCQKGIDGGKELGIEPLLSAKEMSDPLVDHLSMMSYLSKFSNVQPRKGKAERLQIRFNFDNIKVGSQAEFQIIKAEEGVVDSKVTLHLVCETGNVPCDVKWSGKIATCSFIPSVTGDYKLTVSYEDTVIKGCPIEFITKGDSLKVRLLTSSTNMKMGETYDVKVDISGSGRGEVLMECTSPTGDQRYLTSVKDGNVVMATVQPKEVGVWVLHVYFGEEEVQGSPLHLRVNDPQKAWLSGTEEGYVGDLLMFKVNYKAAGEGEVKVTVTCNDDNITYDTSQDSSDAHVRQIMFTPEVKGSYEVRAWFNDTEIRGSPARVSVQDPSQVSVTGEGILHGTKGEDSSFKVNASGVGGNVKVDVSAPDGSLADCQWRQITPDVYEFTYRPTTAGMYKINVLWNGRPLPGSPFHPHITDRSKVVLMDDLTDLKDENDHLALNCNTETVLNFNTKDAGPGTFSAEVLSPDGRLPVNIRKPEPGHVQVGFTAKVEGDHYIHLYWSSVPLDKSPILAYCPGPVLPVNHAHVNVVGEGAQLARATVPAEFIVDGKKAGPGIPRVRMTGVKTDVDVEMRAMKYDRYKCKYAAPYPGGYLLHVEWSGFHVPGSPFKVTVTNKGHGDKVKVEGQGLKGGFVGQQLRAVVDTTAAGNGEVTADCYGLRHHSRCDLIDHRNGKYTLCIFPTEPCRHSLEVKYDHEHVPGSPFSIPVGEPPDPRKVHVYGPGIEPGVIQTFESKFIVETYGAGAGQLSVRVRGPRSAFKVEMRRDREEERTIVCRYDPEEAGEYIVNVKWSGVHVPGSPFTVPVFESIEALSKYARQTNQVELIADYEWKDEF